MAEFNDINELKALKARGAIDEAQYQAYLKVMVRKIVSDRRERAHSKNGVIYILLAFFTGTIGLHNFYAGYWRRGLVQLGLTLTAWLFMYFPLIFTSLWALAELLFVSHSAGGIPLRGNRAVLWGLRLAAILVLIIAYKHAELVTIS